MNQPSTRTAARHVLREILRQQREKNTGPATGATVARQALAYAACRPHTSPPTDSK